jgi:hypothetical protein
MQRGTVHLFRVYLMASVPQYLVSSDYVMVNNEFEKGAKRSSKAVPVTGRAGP